MLFEQGKIGAIGVSNFSVKQMEQFRRVAPIHVLQPPFNLFERSIEQEVLPYCRKNKIATFGYGALCRGLLSGRMQATSKFQGDDLRGTDPKFQQPRFKQYLAAVQRLDQFAQKRFGKRVIHLEKGELDIDTPEVIKERVIQAIHDNLRHLRESCNGAIDGLVV